MGEREQSSGSTSPGSAPKRELRRISLMNDGGFAVCLLVVAVVVGAVYAAIAPVPKLPEGNTRSINKQKSRLKKQNQKKTAQPNNRKPAKPKNFKPRQITIVGNSLDFSRKPDFNIKGSKKIIPGHSGVKLKSVWKGPKDLSMRIWLGQDANDLVIRADVMDNKHVQDQKGKETLWRDDSIQIAINHSKWKKQWEIDLASRKGEVVGIARYSPPHLEKNLKRLFIESDIRIKKIKGGLRYDIRLPLDVLGLDKKKLYNGFRFNMIANDTDDPKKRRKIWAEIEEGIGQHKDPFAYPVIKFRE